MLTNDHVTKVAGSTDANWRQHAVCSEMDPELWFPEPWEDDTPAKVACHGCPARAACLNYALDANEEYGVWGGLSPEELREVRRRRQRAGRRIAVALDVESEVA
jgi:WhiB family redox-sensing transcriptional regulator